MICKFWIGIQQANEGVGENIFSRDSSINRGTKPGNVFIGLFRLLEGGRDKRRNEATESDVMNILGQCYTTLSLNKNYLYLKFKTITEFLL